MKLKMAFLSYSSTLIDVIVVIIVVVFVVIGKIVVVNMVLVLSLLHSIPCY